MSYIGNTSTTQSFTPAVDYFNGDGTTVAFTLSRPVASVAQVQAVIENVPQNPSSAFSVSGNTITFTSAPPAGTSNVYVSYTSPITQVVQPGQGTVGTQQLLDGSVTTTKIADANVTIAKVSATGTPSASTYLRGDGSWSSISAGLTGTFGQVFTSSGTFTVPSGVTAVKVSLCGGGGNGNAGNACSTGGAGNGAGVAIKYITGLTPGSTVTVTVGNAGGTSSFGAYCSATGGGNGSIGGAATGGTASGGDLNFNAVTPSGQWYGGGGAGVGQLNTYGNTGMLGGSGGGGAYGVNATGYGNGGGAGAGTSTAGTKGVVIVEW